MKYYKLLKDTLTVKAGSIFEEKETFDGEKRLVLVTKDECQFTPWVAVNDIDNFNEWFEKIHERWRRKLGETYWFLSDNGSLYFKTEDNNKIDNYRYRVGNYFKTIEEARAYKKYLLARQVLLDDAEGGEFIKGGKNWHDFYDTIAKTHIGMSGMSYYFSGAICFKDEESLLKSLEEHEAQWEIVRKYEMGEKR